MEKRITSTVCELPNEPEPFEAAWQTLVTHVVEHKKNMVSNLNGLLPKSNLILGQAQ